MKVLITGSTAQHCSGSLAGKMSTFAGNLRDALESQGHVVVQNRPSVDATEDYIEDFDYVLVGLSSPSSLSSNMFYGATITAGVAHRVGNLGLIFDAPEPYNLRAGMAHTVNNPQSLTKDFYKARHEYNKVFENPESIMKIVDYCKLFLEEPLPTVVIPTIPWFSTEFLTNYIPNVDLNKLVMLNFDKEVLKNSRSRKSKIHKQWTTDSKSSNWVKKLSSTINYPLVPYKSGPWADVEAINQKLDASLGSIVSAYRNGDCWWSPLISHSLASGVPVVTEWRHSQVLGPSWFHLASDIELMSASERKALANDQKSSYLSALKDVPDLENIFSEKSMNPL